jgi:DNA-binding NarL/FixJ family response regulator
MSFLKQLAREHPRTRTILITAYPNETLAGELKAGPIDGFLLKPFSVEEMERLLEQVIE